VITTGLVAAMMVGSIGVGVAHALSVAFGMFWEILWALALGFGLSAVVQSVVSKSEMTRLPPDDSPRGDAPDDGRAVRHRRPQRSP
jgi:uncharacterized membrane protein YraQ (UPF0718 family)